MLAPRSFSYKSKPKSHDPEKQLPITSRDSGRGFGWRPDSYRNTSAHQPSPRGDVSRSAHSGTPSQEEQTEQGPSSTQSQATSGSVDASDQVIVGRPRSKPVAVPGRGQPRDSVPRSVANGSPHKASSKKHDPNAMSPSVAALLAMTSIPRKTAFPTYKKSSSSLPRRCSSQQLMEDWKSADIAQESSSLGTSPKLHDLLSPPAGNASLSRSSSADTMEDFSPERSPSTESLPSLMTDDLSTISSDLQFSWKGSPRRASRGKSYSLSKSVDNDFEHPLSFEDDRIQHDEELELVGSPDSTPPATRRPSTARKQSTFKSNLTASLTALKSSWRSISNFAATPYTIPEDHLSRGLFAESQTIQREMRPRPMKGPPSAELRRYLNPSAYHKSPHSDFHSHGRTLDHADLHHVSDSAFSEDDANEGSLIALQDRLITDARSTRSSDNASSDPASTEAGRAMQEPNQHYRRELRENGEWLRICVLETNMRRAGKLEGPGHAQIWLPARTSTDGDSSAEITWEGERRVPRRWVAVLA